MSAQQISSEELRQRAKEEAERQKRLQDAPDVHLETQKKISKDTFELPDEKPCFLVASVILEGEGTQDFPWAQEYLNNYSGKCVGKTSINIISNRLTGRFIEKGYITTRIVIPEQDLTKKRLALKLVRGVIRDIRFSDPAIWGTWKSAFPARPGDMLNLRDLEQGLEQMKRLPYQDVDMQLVPGEKPGETDVVIAVKRGKPWAVSASIDDSGSKSTEKWQYSVNFTFNNLLGLNDLLTIGTGHDLKYSGIRGTESYNFFYSIPWGYWTFSMSGSTYRYRQDVEGTDQRYIYSGLSEYLSVGLQRLLHRGQVSKTSLELRINKRNTKSFLEYVEIESQQFHTTYAELALLHRHYIGAAQIDISLGYRQGMPWFNATKDYDGDDESEYPTHFYRMITMDAGASVPFQLGIPLRYTGSFRGQYTEDRLFLQDAFSIGNRWTVRGFDGEQTLAAENGFFVRNEIQAPLARTGSQIYAGIDYGYLFGPNSRYLAGNQLVGFVLGMRGSWKGFGFDVSLGLPLYKPGEFVTDHFTTTVQLFYQF